MQEIFWFRALALRIFCAARGCASNRAMPSRASALIIVTTSMGEDEERAKSAVALSLSSANIRQEARPVREYFGRSEANSVGTRSSVIRRAKVKKIAIIPEKYRILWWIRPMSAAP